MDLIVFLWAGVVAAFVALIVLNVVLLVKTQPYPIINRSEEEKFFVDPKTQKKVTFPSIKDTYEVNLSVIVPAYNEQDRLPLMLDEALGYLEAKQEQDPKFTYEVIVVSDGSSDKTVEIAQAYAQEFGGDKVRCLKLIKNRGKGGAVRLGVQSCRGATVLFADADGATKFEDLSKLERELKRITKLDPLSQPGALADVYAIVIGSRAHLEQESLATRSFFRNVLMKGFHFLVWLLTVEGVRDTQCGFKLLTRRAAATTFASLHIERWAFDVELLYIAQKLNIPISEIPVRWTEIDGSKVTPVLSWIQMGLDLGFIWLKYTIGAWKIQPKNE